MLIERSQLVIGLITIVFILLGTVFAVFSTGGLLVRGHTVIADFIEADGLSDGDFVYSSGVRVGQVTAVDIVDSNDPDAEPCLESTPGIDFQRPGRPTPEIAETCVRVTMKIDDDGVPLDSAFEVTLQNALGRRQVRIIPPRQLSSESPDRVQAAVAAEPQAFLTDGTRIGLDQTYVPTDLPELGDQSAELLEGVETERLNELAISLADVLEGKQQEVSDLLDALDTITAVIADRKDDLAKVLEEASTLVDAAADKDQQIVSIIDDFGSTLELLAARRAEISRLVNETANATNISADLVEDRQAQIDRILTELRTDLAIIDDHQVEIADFLAVLGVGFEGYAGIGWNSTNENPDYGNVFTTQLGPLGYGGLLDCGGVTDVVLTALFGPDPNCADADMAGVGGTSFVTSASSVQGHPVMGGRPQPMLDTNGDVVYPSFGAWFLLGGGQ